MPAEPELPPVEAMLRDAARQRRDAFDAAGPGAATMPGPTRARLHEELARRFDTPAREATSSGGLPRWWLGFAGLAGAAAVVALLAVANQKTPGRPATVAAGSASPIPREVAALPAPAPALPPPAAPAATPVAEVAREVVATRQDQPAADAAAASLSKAKDAPAPVNAPTLTAGVLRAQTFTQTPLSVAASPMKNAADARRRSEAPAAPATAPAPGARGGAAATGQATSAPAATSLLENFRFEQQGENVRVVDADGSVYTGQVETDKKMPAPRAENARSQTQAAVTDNVSPSQVAAGENFHFRATGDNRTLQKPVVFEGEYSTQLLGMPAAKKSASKADAQILSNSNFNSEAQIRGRVRVLDGKDKARDTEVDARAVEPATPR